MGVERSLIACSTSPSKPRKAPPMGKDSGLHGLRRRFPARRLAGPVEGWRAELVAPLEAMDEPLYGHHLARCPSSEWRRRR